MPEVHALIHLCWWRHGKEERRLLFGWVELFPSGVPGQAGHPFVAHEIGRNSGTYINVARFPMTADQAVEWFSEAAKGVCSLAFRIVIEGEGCAGSFRR